MPREIVYRGVSWADLTVAFDQQSLWVGLTPARGGTPVLARVVRLSDFQRDGSFRAHVIKLDGTPLELWGHASHSSEPAEFELL